MSKEKVNIKEEESKEEKEKEEEKEEANKCERQISVTTGSHQIQLVTEYPEETMDYLIDRALVVLDYCEELQRKDVYKEVV